VSDRGKFLGRPFALAGIDDSSARVLSLNPCAGREGVRRGMVLAEARRFCKSLEVFTPRPELFSKTHRSVLEFLGGFSPMIEPAKSSFYLDLSGTGRLLGPGSEVGAKLLKEIDSRFRLISSAGIASNKLVGNAACSLARAPGLAQVLPAQEASFLRPFPLKKILFHERGLADRLFELGISHVSDLQQLSVPELCSAFGRDGHRPHLISQGIDFSPVVPAESFPEIEEGESLARASNDFDLLRAVLWRLCENLGRRLRERKLSVCLLRVLIVFRDGAGSERRAAFKKPTALDREIQEAAQKLLLAAFYRRVQVIFIGVRGSRLAAGFQPDLFGEVDAKKRLYFAIDGIRSRFGAKAIGFGVEQCRA
jgi:DNA polymerase-4